MADERATPSALVALLFESELVATKAPAHERF
jgi:hypothetical protein